MRSTDDWYRVVVLANVRLNQPKNPRFSCLYPFGIGFSNVAQSAGVSDIARKTEIELSGQTPAEIAAIQAKFELIQTRGDARAYIESVWEKLKMARPERNV